MGARSTGGRNAGGSGEAGSFLLCPFSAEVQEPGVSPREKVKGFKGGGEV